MSPYVAESLQELLDQVTGFIYPERGRDPLGAAHRRLPVRHGPRGGAFILASLVKVFSVKEVQPVYRLALLTALAFLLVAPMPLLMHLGRPERFYEILLTPNPTSAMSMFGFVYAWYLMVVLLLEIWITYRKDLIEWSNN